MNPSQSSTGACYECGINITILLLTSNNRRFCPNCFLKQNKATFCPICFELFDGSFLPNLHIRCLSCPSAAHQSCLVSSTFLPNLSSFRCPPCADPNFKFQSEEAAVAAAQISANSLSEAATAARLHANERALEAAKAKMKALEALEHVCTLFSKKKEGTSSKK